MDHRHQQYYDRVSELVLAYLTPVLVQKLDGQVDLIQQAKNSLDEYYANIDQEENKVGVLELVRKMKTLKETLSQSVNGIAVIDKDVDLDKDFEQYFSELKNYTETLPESLLEYQSLDRFQPFTGDPFKIRVGKRLKKWALIVGWAPSRIANWFRRKTNKPEKDLAPWKHHIPLQGMITYHFRDLLVEQLIDMVQAINRSIASSTHELYLTEASLDQKFASLIGEEEQDGLTISTPNHSAEVDEILKKVTQLLETIQGMTANRLQRINEMFQINYEMVGTIELSVKNFEGSGLEAVHRQAKKAYRKTMDGWRNTLTVLSDRYNFDHELFKTRFTNLEQYLFVSNKLETRISEKIKDDISQIAEFLAARKRQLEVSSAEDADFKKSLVAIRFEISRFLKQSIPACIQLIREQNVPALLENLEAKTKNQVSQLSETLSMVKNISYEHAIKESDIGKIAPKDLITFEALPEYLNKIRSLHSNFTEVIESTQQLLMEISNICDFNLETALAALEDKSQHDRAKSMSIEGIERAHSRLQDILEDLSKLAAIGDKTIHDGVLEFNDSIMALNEIDEAFDTQVRIAKAKALEKTKALRAEFIGQIKQIIPRLITNLRRRGLMVYKQYRETSLKYGIGNPTKVLNAEISGFLSDTENVIENMPFVYQRLFEISPLDNLYFYEQRQMATLGIRKAYENWEEGHYGATALIAEGGGGATTLIHFFLRDLKSTVSTVQINTEGQIYSRKAFFKLFQETFDTVGLVDTDALVNHLNQLEGKRIIVMEDLEHFFLRTVSGFECIKIFIELITRTNKNIFWLTTINEYSYQYLVKTANIDEYFSYNIVLKPLRPAQVTSLVLKRHRVSGFNIQFRPHKQDRKNSKFKKMDDEQQQEYLENEFFESLNRIAQSNISLALIYWLRSITEIEEDVMYVGSLKGIDFSFLTSLSTEKLFTLHALLLHDGLTIDDHAKIFQQALEKSKLTILPMDDDGLIVHKEGLFYLNPLLYRQAVNLLKAKNIIH